MIIGAIDPAVIIVMGCLVASLVSLAISIVAIFVALSAKRG